jgi:hypothetical protein
VNELSNETITAPQYLLSFAAYTLYALAPGQQHRLL